MNSFQPTIHNSKIQSHVMSSKFQISNRLILAGVLLLTFFLYWPGLSGGFIFDDGNAITQNKSIQIDTFTIDSILEAAFSRDSGILRRPISMGSFAINHILTGLDPFYFKLTNVVIHLICGLLIFGIFSQLCHEWMTVKSNTTEDYIVYVPILITCAWLLHPLNLTGVLYVVQRMASLSALFILVGIYTYCIGRGQMLKGEKLGLLTCILSLFLPGALAVLCKENGVLLPLFLLLVECCVYRFRSATKIQKNSLYVLYIVTVVLPSILILLTILIEPDKIITGYGGRDFTAYERLLSEGRILFYYIQQTFIPIPSTMGLFHDGYTLSTNLFNPFSTFLAIIAHTLLALTAIALIRKKPIITFGILWYYISHSLESSIVGLEPVFEHRNYLAILGPLLLFNVALFNFFKFHNLKAWIVSSIFLIILSMALLERAKEWSDPVRHILAEVKHHPESSRANDYAGLIHETVYRQSNNIDNKNYAINYYTKAADLNRNTIEPLLPLLSLVDIEDQKAIKSTLIYRLENAKFHPSWIRALESHVTDKNNIDIELYLLTMLKNPRLSSGPHRANVYNLLAINAEKYDRKEKVGKYIQNAYMISPNNLLFQSGYAHWLQTQKREKEALLIINKALEKPIPIHFRIRFNQLRNHIHQKHTDDK